MKSTTLRAIVMALSLGLIVPAISHAKYGNPENNPWHQTTISYIKHHPHDDQYVVLIGQVVEKRGDDSYVFEDGTGRIKLDTDKKLPVGRTIVVRGHYDTGDWIGFTSREIDVKSWRYDSKKDRQERE